MNSGGVLDAGKRFAFGLEIAKDRDREEAEGQKVAFLALTPVAE